MIPLEEAKARVAEAITVLAPGEVAIADARGLVLAEQIVAAEAIPPFPNTAMDGFAVRSGDLAGASEATPVRLPIVATVAAGSIAPRPLVAGEAMRIMTGAPIPDGADAVVMVELTRAVGEEVDVLAPVPVGNHVRPAGDDLTPGTVVFEVGETLSPAHIGVLASLGRETVLVHARPRVGVFSTGDELVVGPTPLGPGQIRDSNRPTLLALVDEAGGIPIDLGSLPDDEVAIESALREAADKCDVMITSGGVSMGDFDFVKQVLMRLGDLNWMQVAIKPAKPFAFGEMLGTPIFGLPGNPVSSSVSFELFARPSLMKMMGRPDIERLWVWALCDEPLFRTADGKTHFHRAVVRQEADGGWWVRSAGGQGSHQLSALAAANGLAMLPDGDGPGAGARVRVMVLRPS